MTDTTDIKAPGFNFDVFMYGIRRDAPFDGSTLADSIADDEVRRAESAFNSLLKRAEKAEAELAALKGDQVPVEYQYQHTHAGKVWLTVDKPDYETFKKNGWPTRELFTSPQKPVVLPEAFYPDGDIDCELVINLSDAIAAIEAAGGIVKDGE